MRKLLFLTFIAIVLAVQVLDAQVIDVSPPYITSLKTKIFVHKNSVLTVSEDVAIVTAGRVVRHGITRFLPTSYNNEFAHQKIVSYKIKKVLLDGKPVPYQLAQKPNGILLYIGDKNTLLPAGSYHYHIQYQASNVIAFGKVRDTLRWNVVGSQWRFPILSTNFDIDFANKVDPDTFLTQMYSGTPNSMQEITDLNAVPNYFPPGNTELIILSFPKNAVSPQSFTSKILWSFSNNKIYWIAILLLFLLSFAVLYYLYKNRQKLAARSAVYPLYTAPEGFSPAACAYILNQKFNNKMFTAAILNMANKGYITIDKEDDFILIESKENAEKLTPPEQQLVKILFDSSSRIKLGEYNSDVAKAKSIFASALKGRFTKTYITSTLSRFMLLLLPAVIFSVIAIVSAFAHADSQQIVGLIASCVVIGFISLFNVVLRLLGYTSLAFVKNAVRGTKKKKLNISALLGLGMALLVMLSMIVVICFMLNFANLILFAVLLYIVWLYTQFYDKCYYQFTPAGQAAQLQILGLKMYLTHAEKLRLERTEAPTKTEQLYSELLPYAFALGVTQNWANQFDGMIDLANYSPNWYEGTGSFDALAMGSSMTSSYYNMDSSSSNNDFDDSGSDDNFTDSIDDGGDGGGGGGGW